MAGDRRDLLFRLLGDASDLNRATGKGSKGLDRMDKSAGRANTGLRKLATGGLKLVGGAIAGAAIAGWTRDAIKMADQAAVVGESFRKTFGAAAQDLNRDLEQTRKLMGLTESQMEKTLVPLGQLGKSLGLTEEAAANIGKELVEAAGDLAAFSGDVGRSDEALASLGSALKGEFDSLEQWGIKLNQAAVNQRALTDTGKESADQLTDQEKLLATVALALAQVDDEQGALADSAETAAGKANTLKAALGDIQEAVGEALLPSVMELGDAIVGLEDELRILGTIVLPAGIRQIFEFVGAIFESIEALAKWDISVEESAKVFLNTFVFGILSKIPVVKTAIDAFARFNAARFRGAAEAVRPLLDAIRAIPGALRSARDALAIRFPRVNLPGFAGGGIVPGAPGQATPILAHGGERVMTPQDQRNAGGGGGGAPLIGSLTVQAGVGDPQAIAQTIISVLQEYNRTNGAISIATQAEGI